MNEDVDRNAPRRSTRRRSWSRLLIAAVSFSMLMAVGPGVLLVNQPRFLWGVPWVYAWAIGWYLILSGIAGVAFWKVWSDDDSVRDQEKS